ncbi:hypothetical protein [Streptomyces sp. Rer75]|uniref:hypothetical protein n=1 Tax=Streptomyces sp. Rer75 TaxID=2750011 RepID=UPI0015D08BBB|nr:hypothetical protein [Streptomyces sp. Rer75]QLH19297.1 hypothetical protein HYQ63_00125 [Streptomyces sp. Rer75]
MALQSGLHVHRRARWGSVSTSGARAAPGDGEWVQLAGLLGEDAPACVGERETWNNMQFHSGQRAAEKTQRSEDDPQKLFTEACLHGLRARLSEDIDSLDHYLSPRVAELARKVAMVLKERIQPPRNALSSHR